MGSTTSSGTAVAGKIDPLRKYFAGVGVAALWSKSTDAADEGDQQRQLWHSPGDLLI